MIAYKEKTLKSQRLALNAEFVVIVVSLFALLYGIWYVPTFAQGSIDTPIALSGHTDRVFSVAWSPDGKTIATASGDKTVQLWDPVSGQSIRTMTGHTDMVNSVAWSP